MTRFVTITALRFLGLRMVRCERIGPRFPTMRRVNGWAKW